MEGGEGECRGQNWGGEVNDGAEEEEEEEEEKTVVIAAIRLVKPPAHLRPRTHARTHHANADVCVSAGVCQRPP
ncbi:hypothetical protein TSMEX_005217 [Taenia solium]|eukprot:TsM_000272600 transcript=TsM_000272600 gene=TsM_000272600